MLTSCFRASLIALALLLSFPAVSATLEELYEQPKIKNIKISPTGEYLAIKVFEEGKHGLLFMGRESPDILGGLKFRGNSEVGDYYWANDERVVSEIYNVGESQEAPRFFGELYAVNFDGKRAESIFGYRSGENRAGSQGSTGSFIKQKEAEYAWGEIIDPFPANEKEILIASTPMSDSSRQNPAAVMIDMYTGVEKNLVFGAKFPYGRFYTDNDGKIRLVVSITPNNRYHIEGLPDGAANWIEFPNTSFGENFSPVAITSDSKSAYVLDNVDGDKVGLYKMALDGSSYKRIYANEEVDITSVNRTADERGVYAMRIDKDYPSYLVFSNSSEEAKNFKSLLQTFPGQVVSITSRSDDGQFWVIHTSSDVDAGSFYLYDKVANSLKLLFRSMAAVNPADLVNVEPISYESFDGQKITGYFTPGKTDKSEVQPLVVLVHGGPRVRDYWEYDSDVQALALAGYSVLQINYRGSSGFGDDFLRAGNRHWGDLIQQDIISGTRWAIEQGKAKEGKVCIMGGSFGAYSALQSSILEPDLFACAVANAGIYDLELMYQRGDIESSYVGDEYLEEVIGRDTDELRKFSPVHNVAALKAPVFIAHGKRDQRAPFEHAERLEKALDAADKKYEMFVKTREAHGFYDTANKVEYMNEALKFLNEHLR